MAFDYRHLSSTFSTGPLAPYLESKLDELRSEISKMTEQGIDGPNVRAAVEAAEVGPVDLREPELAWEEAGAGIEVDLTVPYAGDTVALVYDSDPRGFSRMDQPLKSWQLHRSQQQVVASKSWRTPPPPAEVTAWRDEVVRALNGAVDRSNQLINEHNTSLPAVAEAATAARRSSLGALDALTEELGPPRAGL